MRVGDTITLYGIGFGNVAPRVDAGRAATGNTALDLPIEFSFDGVPGTLRYAGLGAQFPRTLPVQRGSARGVRWRRRA